MIGFRSTRSPHDARLSAARGAGDGIGAERTDRGRRFGRRLMGLLGEVGAAIEEQPGASAERR